VGTTKFNGTSPEGEVSFTIRSCRSADEECWIRIIWARKSETKGLKMATSWRQGNLSSHQIPIAS